MNHKNKNERRSSKKKWSLVRRRTGGHIFKRLCAPGPQTMLTSAKTRISCEKHAFFENRHEKIDKMQENENRVRADNRRFCPVLVRRNIFVMFSERPLMVRRCYCTKMKTRSPGPHTMLRWKSLIFPEGNAWSRQQRAVNRRLRHVRSLPTPRSCRPSGPHSFYHEE